MVLECGTLPLFPLEAVFPKACGVLWGGGVVVASGNVSKCQRVAVFGRMASLVEWNEERGRSKVSLLGAGLVGGRRRTQRSSGGATKKTLLFFCKIANGLKTFLSIELSLTRSK